jgi:hypothetical protein
MNALTRLEEKTIRQLRMTACIIATKKKREKTRNNNKKRNV